MITEKILIKNNDGKQLTFSTSSDYHVNIKKDVTGLSDASNEIFTQKGLGQYGETVTGFQIGSRAIEIKGSFKPTAKNMVASLRQTLNNVLSPEKSLEIIYDLGGVQKKIYGIARDLNFSVSEIFYDFYIAILCPDPLWRELEERATSIVSWQGAFEFPVEIDSDWQIGTLVKKYGVSVLNSGDVTCGCRAVFTASASSVTNPMIKNTDTDEFLKFGVTLAKDDKLEVCTEYKKKSAYITRANGSRENAIQYLDPDSAFLQLDIGENHFTYSAQSGSDKLEITIFHSNLYRGV